MKKLIDTLCRGCGTVEVDVWVGGLEKALLPICPCGERVERAWLSAPSITPNGTRVEVNTDPFPKEAKVDTRAIAQEREQMVIERRAHYGNEELAERNVWREINHEAGKTDTQGNVLPDPTPPPITFAKPALSDCAI